MRMQNQSHGRHAGVKSFFGFLITTVFSFSYMQGNTLNTVEKSISVANIPLDVLAHHYDFSPNKKRAALLHCGVDLVNILNKGLHFYNNYQAQLTAGGFSFSRDVAANTVWTARDVSLIISHFKQYLELPAYNPIETSLDDDDDNDDTDVFDEDEPFIIIANEKIEDQEKISPKESESPSTASCNLPYPLHVVAIPTFKGLASYALACAQDQECGLYIPAGRRLAAAAHSLSRLLDEYSYADPKSSHKHLFLVLILANIIWVAKEYKAYQDYRAEVPPFGSHQIDRVLQHPPHRIIGEEEELENIVALEQDERVVLANNNIPQRLPAAALQEQVGNCPICFEDNIPVKMLGNGHNYCNNCLQEHIRNQILLPNIPCPRPGCNHQHGEAGAPAGTLSQGQVRAIINSIDDQERRRDLTNLYNRRFDEPRAALPGAVRCGRAGCNGIILNPHRRQANVECPGCNNLICAVCGVNHPLNISCVAARFNALDEQTRNRIRRSENRILCPRCFGYVERNAACPHMTHRRDQGGCDHQFCLYCLDVHPNHEDWCQGRRYYDNTPEGRGERVDPV